MSQRSSLIKRAIDLNTRYLTGGYTGLTFNFMKRHNLFAPNEIYHKNDDSLEGVDRKRTIIEYFDRDESLMLDYMDRYENNKPYKYGAVFGYDVPIDEEIFNNQTIFRETAENYSLDIESPVVIRDSDSDSIILKFQNAIGDIRDRSTWFAFPIVVSIYPSDRILIIRLDASRHERTIKNFYRDKVESVKNWMFRNLNLNLTNIDLLQNISEIVRLKEEENLFEDSTENIRDGLDLGGGRVKLKSGDSESMRFLDELRDFSERMENEDDSLKLKGIISHYFENMCYTERGLKFSSDGTKEISMELTVKKGIESDDIQMVHFYGNAWTRERVIYGIRYIKNYRNQINRAD